MTNDPALGRLEVQIMRMIFIIYDIGRGEKMGKLQGEFRIADFLKKRDDCGYLEALIVYHGAPTLQGIKPANLVNLRAEGRDIQSIWPCCKKKLVEELGVQIREIRQSKDNLLILIYRPELLMPRFWCQGAQKLLIQYQYPTQSLDLENWLDRLVQRFLEEEMPHEVGIFLGYPAQDVCEFIRRNGACSKASGLWKVYGNVSRARRKFRKYQGAIHFAGCLLQQGAELADIRMNLRGRSSALAMI